MTRLASSIPLTAWAAKPPPDPDGIVSFPGEVHNVPRGAVLRARRVGLGLSVAAVASLTGMTTAALHAIEAEDTRVVALRQRVADALSHLSATQEAQPQHWEATDGR